LLLRRLRSESKKWKLALDLQSLGRGRGIGGLKCLIETQKSIEIGSHSMKDIVLSAKSLHGGMQKDTNHHTSKRPKIRCPVGKAPVKA
jgi:hypothetical protein